MTDRHEAIFDLHMAVAYAVAVAEAAGVPLERIAPALDERVADVRRAVAEERRERAERPPWPLPPLKVPATRPAVKP